MVKPAQPNNLIDTSVIANAKKKAFQDTILKAPNPLLPENKAIYDDYGASINYAARLIYNYLTAADQPATPANKRTTTAETRQAYPPEPYYKRDTSGGILRPTTPQQIDTPPTPDIDPSSANEQPVDPDKPILLDIGLYEHMVKDHSPINELGLSGAQWEYAYEAAQTLLALTSS